MGQMLGWCSAAAEQALLEEAGPRRVGVRPVEEGDLQRHRPGQLGVEGPVDGAHAALAELAVDAIAAELPRQVARRRPRERSGRRDGRVLRRPRRLALREIGHDGEARVGGVQGDSARDEGYPNMKTAEGKRRDERIRLSRGAASSRPLGGWGRPRQQGAGLGGDDGGLAGAARFSITFVRRRSLAVGRSCSSSMSPTISSSTSSRVISPKMWSSSSRTRAIGRFALRNSRSALSSDSSGFRYRAGYSASCKHHHALQAEQIKQVFRIDDADDVIDAALVDRHAHVRAGAHRLQDLFGRRAQLQGGHLVARDHAVADVLVRQAEDVLHEIGLIGVEHAGLLGVLDEENQLVDGMGRLLAAHGPEAEAAQDQGADAVHHQQQRPHDADEDDQRPGQPQRGAVRVLQAPAPWESVRRRRRAGR